MIYARLCNYTEFFLDFYSVNVTWYLNLDGSPESDAHTCVSILIFIRNLFTKVKFEIEKLRNHRAPELLSNINTMDCHE